MPITGYMKIDEIQGESVRAGHEDEIDVFGLHWKTAQASSANSGSGRTQSRAQVSAFTCRKVMDASSPYLALACMQGKSIPEITVCVRKDSGEAHLDYLTVVMENCIISSYEMENDGSEPNDQMISEVISISFEIIKETYVVQADDHSAGAEHSIEYDVVAGA